MAGRKIINSVIGAEDWTSEIESKNILKKGFISIELTADSQSIAAGSSVDIDGVIYKFDTDELISGTVPDGNNFITITGGSTATASYSTDDKPEYDNIKKGYYGTSGERFVKSIYSIQNSIQNSPTYFFIVENNPIEPYNYRALCQLVSNTPLTNLTTDEVSGLGTRLIINIGILWKTLIGHHQTMINPFTRTSRVYDDQSLTEDDQYVVNNKGFNQLYFTKGEINYLFDLFTLCQSTKLGVMTGFGQTLTNPFTGITFTSNSTGGRTTPDPIKVIDNTYYTVTEIKDLTDISVQEYVNLLKTLVGSHQTITNPYSGNSITSNN